MQYNSWLAVINDKRNKKSVKRNSGENLILWENCLVEKKKNVSLDLCGGRIEMQFKSNRRTRSSLKGNASGNTSIYHHNSIKESQETKLFSIAPSEFSPKIAKNHKELMTNLKFIINDNFKQKKESYESKVISQLIEKHEIKTRSASRASSPMKNNLIVKNKVGKSLKRIFTEEVNKLLKRIS